MGTQTNVLAEPRDSHTPHRATEIILHKNVCHSIKITQVLFVGIGSKEWFVQITKKFCGFFTFSFGSVWRCVGHQVEWETEHIFEKGKKVKGTDTHEEKRGRALADYFSGCV